MGLRRKAISGIIAATILFAMLFTVGTGFFLLVNNTNSLYSIALANRGNAIQDQINENLVVTTLLKSTHIGLYLNNTGGKAVNVTSIYVLDSSGTVLTCLGRGMPVSCSNSNPALPILVNPSQGSATIDTTYTYVSGTQTVKVVTQRGSVFSASYPPSSNSLAAFSLSSGAFGSLYMKFDSYSYFQVYSGGGCPASGGGNSGYCLSNQGKAFQIAASFASSNNIGFSITFTNVDPKQANITMDKYTNIVDYWPVGSSFRTDLLYLISNTTSTILSQYTPIVLYYNKPVTLVFASLNPGAFSPGSFSGSGAPTSGVVSGINIISHGWKAISYSKITGGSPPASNYGQNSPYVSTLFT